MGVRLILRYLGTTTCLISRWEKVLSRHGMLDKEYSTKERMLFVREQSLDLIQGLSYL